ncbi:hypothetical protein D3C81_819660 [compost metagenome]
MIEFVQARGIGPVQAQRRARGVFMQVEFTKGAHHRLDPAVGQGNAQCGAVEAATVKVDQQVFVVAAPGQFVGAQQFRAAAQQLQHDRQQAVALAIDHDAQFQVEPFMPRGFVDAGVPVVHLLQVEGKIAVDVDYPAGFTQARQAVAGEVQPGLVIGQLVHFAGAVGQGLALPGGGLEAQVA